MTEMSGVAVGPRANAVLGVLGNCLALPDKLGNVDALRLQTAVVDVAHYALPELPDKTEDTPNHILRLPQWELPAVKLIHLRMAVGKILLGNMTGGYSSESVRKTVPTEHAARNVELFDEAGILDAKFWADFGIYAVASTKTPQFLPLLHAKLSGPMGGDILQQVPHPQAAARLFTAKVVQSYAKHPERSAVNAERILHRIAPRGSGGDSIDLKLLVEEANRLTTAYNARFDDDQPDNLVTNRLVSVGDAFLRMLSVTRLPETSSTVRAAQLEQDLSYADIISMVLAQRRPQSNLSRTDLALRFPELTPQHRRRIHELVQLGMPLGEAVALPYKPKNR